jgi:hypothetical protein
MNPEAEGTFSTTTRLLFGKGLAGIDSYGEWLMRHLGKEVRLKSMLGGGKLRIVRQYPFMELIPKNRMISFGEKGAAAGLKMEIGEGASLREVLEGFGQIACFNLDMRKGEDRNNVETVGVEDTVNTYKAQDAFNSKGVAYTSYTKFSECSFGCYRLFYSKYCINCYNCVKCTGCFECDSCKESSGAYFCHNCENVHDAMFCSNAKNLRYAIGNVEVGRGRYAELKKILLDYVLGELEKKKSADLDIFSIGEA